MWKPVSEHDLRGQIYYIVRSIIEERSDQIEVHLEYPVRAKPRTSMKLVKTKNVLGSNTYVTIDSLGRKHIHYIPREGAADLVINRANRKLLVLEIKKGEVSKSTFLQCYNYACLLDADYFAVCNSRTLSLFRNPRDERLRSLCSNEKRKPTKDQLIPLIKNCIDKFDHLNPLSKNAWIQILDVIKKRNVKTIETIPITIWKLVK